MAQPVEIDIFNNMNSGKIAMQIEMIAMDPKMRIPVVTLQEINGGRTLQLWIGAVEASSIAMGLEGITASRPLTHDLMAHMVEALGAKLLDVGIVDAREGTYYAVLTLELKGQQVHVDARPSDAMALALRLKVPIFCAASILQRVEPKEPYNEGPRQFMKNYGKSPSEILENLKPNDFGKYLM